MYSTKCWMEHPEGFISVDTRLWWGENMRCLQALSCRPSPPEAACKHLLDLWRIFWQISDRTPFSPTLKAMPTYYLVKIFSPVHTGTCFFSVLYFCINPCVRTFLSCMSLVLLTVHCRTTLKTDSLVDITWSCLFWYVAKYCVCLDICQRAVLRWLMFNGRLFQIWHEM